MHVSGKEIAMKKWTLCLLCTITLGLAFAGLASAEPAHSADQQFLASLANPTPTLMAKPQPPPNPCGPDFCTSAQRTACFDYCFQTVFCDGYLACNNTTCTSNCICGPRCY
jgi:hypothetical protein